MSYEAHKETKNGYILKIIADDSPESPREWDNLGTMVCWHRGYNLGDKHNFSDPEAFFAELWKTEATEKEKRDFILEACKGNISAFREILEYSYRRDTNSLFEATIERIKAPDTFPESVIYLNLNVYEQHGGITMNTGGFSCPWDSGQVGWIYTTQAKIESEGHKDTPIEKIREYLDGEVKTYAQYLEGDVYGFVVSKVNTCECCDNSEDEELDSCWGFFGTEDALREGRLIIESYTKEQPTA